MQSIYSKEELDQAVRAEVEKITQHFNQTKLEISTLQKQV